MRARRRERGCPSPPPPQRLAFDAGGAEPSPLPETEARQINTDGGRDSAALFMGLVTGPLLSQSP